MTSRAIEKNIWGEKRREIASYLDYAIRKDKSLNFVDGAIEFHFCYRPFFRCVVELPPCTSSSSDRNVSFGLIRIKRSFLFIPYPEVMEIRYMLDKSAKNIALEILSLLNLQEFR